MVSIITESSALPLQQRIMFITIVVLTFLSSTVDAFQLQHPSYLLQRPSCSRDGQFIRPPLPLPPSFLAKKGFDTTSPKKNKKKKSKTSTTSTATTTTTTPDTPASPPIAATTTTTSTENPTTPTTNAGQKALAKLRAEATQKTISDVEKIRNLRTVDEVVKDDPAAAVIPEKVAQRMGRRMLPFVGVPLFGGMGAFVGFWYFATYRNVQFETGLVAVVTIALLAVGLLGITYSVMSASWDPDREGSGVGFEEFTNNLDSIKDGLKRSRDNAIIRDKMAGMPEEEIQKAIKELDKKEEREKAKTMTLEEKMKRELE